MFKPFKRCPRCEKNNYFNMWIHAPVPTILKGNYEEVLCPQCKMLEEIGEAYQGEGVA
jgi:phage FluMu protein Com